MAGQAGKGLVVLRTYSKEDGRYMEEASGATNTLLIILKYLATGPQPQGETSSEPPMVTDHTRG